MRTTTVGPLDERFGLGLLEDDDYAKRLRVAGYRLVSAEDVFVHHFGEASFGSLFQSGAHQRLLRENQTRYAEKWGTPWQPYARRTTDGYDDVIEATRRAVRDAVPPDSPVLLISRGDDRLLDVDDRVTWHFPRDADGVWAGHYPADSETAVSFLREQIEAGARYLVVPRTAMWWLQFYDGLSHHLAAKAEEVHADHGLPDLPTADTGRRRRIQLRRAKELVTMGIQVTRVDLGEQSDEAIVGRDIDHPAVGTVVETLSVEVIGWVVGANGEVDEVVVHSDDRYWRSLPLDQDRPDLAAAFPGVPTASQAGFRTKIGLRGMTRAEIGLHAKMRDGRYVHLATLGLERVASPDEAPVIGSIGTIDLGDLRRSRPVSKDWGYERGAPIDRYYIEAFLGRSCRAGEGPDARGARRHLHASFRPRSRHGGARPGHRSGQHRGHDRRRSGECDTCTVRSLRHDHRHPDPASDPGHRRGHPDPSSHPGAGWDAPCNVPRHQPDRSRIGPGSMELGVDDQLGEGTLPGVLSR